MKFGDWVSGYYILMKYIILDNLGYAPILFRTEFRRKSSCISICASVLDLATVIRELLMYLVLCVWLCCFFDPCCSRSSSAVDRGREWNPLRQRLDSFDYTVRQHIVGSLLFTLLLLLLPTSVFYIFFTILSAAIALTCILIEVTISMIHNTPYIKIFIWLVRRRRCPFGASFEIASCQNDSLELACHDRVCSSSEKSYLKNDIKPKPNRTGRFFQNFNRFNRFFFRFDFFNYFFSSFLSLINFWIISHLLILF
jgi:hypothetical protein